MSAVPAVPHIFYGVVKANGTPVTGTVRIEARIDNIHYGLTVGSGGRTTHGIDGDGFNYGTQSKFLVCADDSATDVIEGGATGDAITFFIEDIQATPSTSVTFSTGSQNRLDLDYDPAGTEVAATPSDDACTIA